jgi:hypothetical protein
MKKILILKISCSKCYKISALGMVLRGRPAMRAFGEVVWS